MRKLGILGAVSFARALAGPRLARALIGAWLACTVIGCAPESEPPGSGERPADSETPTPAEVRWTFTDVTEDAGIDFIHFNDASEQRFLPETMGAGAAFFDFDRDGWMDLYLVNGAPLAASGTGPTGKLYRNRDGRFEDVTEGSGLDVSFYGMGVAAGDIDGDGLDDLFVSAVGQDRIFRNIGGGRFEDVTIESGLVRGGDDFSTSAAFLDYDRDGDLDIFVARYVEWSAATDRECRPDGVHRAYCTPENYPAIASRLWRNDTTGPSVRFTDVSEPAGIGSHPGKALGVVVFDHDGDRWPDLVVANDTERNFLFRNRGDGTFEEIGVDAGLAYSESGAARGGMGIDTGDLDANGRTDVLIGNFSYEMTAFFRARASGVYMDDAAGFGLGLPTLTTLAFGLRVVDLDLDGWPDVVVANGHIEPEIERMYPGQAYAQLPQVFRNREGGALEEVRELADLARPMVGRGLAVADFDRDGDSDLLLTQNGRRARLFRNDTLVSRERTPDRASAGGDGRHPGEAAGQSAGAPAWLRVRLLTPAGSPAAYGSRVRLHAGGVTREQTLRSGGSYLSASEPALNFGLASGAVRVDSLVVEWPSGARSVHLDPELRREIELRAPR